MGWLIFIDILLIIVLALMLSVTVNIHLNDETRIKIRYAGITIFSVSPEDEKHKKQKKSKEKQKKSPDGKSDNISADNEKPVQNTESTADKANGSSDISKESKKTHKVGKKQITTATMVFFKARSERRHRRNDRICKTAHLIGIKTGKTAYRTYPCK
ncbi:MAG: hypothetical protein ACLTZI_15740 [[Eubacterium] siraeum]